MNQGTAAERTATTNNDGDFSIPNLPPATYSMRHPYLTGRDNLRRLDAFDASTDPATQAERIGAALERVGLAAAATKTFRRYSLGMKQRLGLAAALAAAARFADSRRADERPRPARHP